jgi:hypothetical protein
MLGSFLLAAKESVSLLNVLSQVSIAWPINPLILEMGACISCLN